MADERDAAWTLAGRIAADTGETAADVMLRALRREAALTPARQAEIDRFVAELNDLPTRWWSRVPEDGIPFETGEEHDFGVYGPKNLEIEPVRALAIAMGETLSLAVERAVEERLARITPRDGVADGAVAARLAQFRLACDRLRALSPLTFAHS